MPGTSKLSIQLLGPLTVRAEDGSDVTPRNRKTRAVIAALCVAADGRRGRKWLQSLLWSDRSPPQSAGSLRGSLTEIRRSFGEAGTLLIAEGDSVRLDLEQIDVDVLNPSEALSSELEFLEGLNVRDPAFDEWLSEQRAFWQQELRPANNQTAPATARITAIAPEPPASDWALSVAVMPLKNKTPDPAMAYKAEGISEDIINCDATCA